MIAQRSAWWRTSAAMRVCRPKNGRPWPGSTSTSAGHLAAQGRERAEIVAERVRLRLHRVDRDVGRDARDHLIGGEEETARRVQQHRLLQRVPAAGQHRDRAAAERQRLSRLQPAIGGGHAGGDAQVVVAAAEHLLGDRVRQAVPPVEPAIILRPKIARCVLQAEAEQVLGARHQQIEAEAVAHPAGEADMVGVVVRHDQARQPGAGERPGEHRLPDRAARLVADPAIEHRPALAIGDQVDVDVIEPERQRQAQPQHAGCDLQRRAEGGRRGMGEDQLGVVRGLRHGQ